MGNLRFVVPCFSVLAARAAAVKHHADRGRLLSRQRNMHFLATETAGLAATTTFISHGGCTALGICLIECDTVTQASPVCGQQRTVRLNTLRPLSVLDGSTVEESASLMCGGSSGASSSSAVYSSCISASVGT